MSIEYIDLCNRLLSEGEWVYNERTGKRCLTVINADFEYDVSQGCLPVLTTKKAYWKAAVAEILGYLRGYNNAQQFADIGCNTWFANANENESWLANPHRKGDGDMGMAYRFRDNGYCIKTEFKSSKYEVTGNIPYSQELIEPNYDNNSLGYVGNIRTSANCGEYIVIEECKPPKIYNGKSVNINYLKVQFLKTGYIKTVDQSTYKLGTIKDPYYPTISGIACLGEEYKKSKYDELLLDTWHSIIGRCYDQINYDQTWHGDNGVTVCDRWLIYSNFLEDFKNLYNWELKCIFPKEYTIDKDYCKSKVYAPDVCRWSSKKEQAINSISAATTFIAEKDGITNLCKGAKHYVAKLGIGGGVHRKLRMAISGDVIYHNGWKITILDDELTYVEVDQVRSIYAKLKLGIDDRRLIMDSYNPHLIEYTSLPSCMHTHTFSILNGTLYLTSYQRSDDIPLGHGFNQIQVAWLLMIMAQITGLKAGKAFHKIINAHIYEDQMDGIKEQITREPFPLPTLEINPDIKTLEDLETWVTLDDFKLVGYEHHPPIKFNFSV